MFIAAGAGLIQIREKTLSARELFEDALAAVEKAHKADAIVLINDRVDIAIMSGADGVHLGQDDLPAAAARKILGKDAIIGVSTHSHEQVRSALIDGNANYIAFGPIFSTSTKSDHEPVVGPEAIRQIKLLTGEVPLVAIGGINKGNLANVLAAGADSAAMISEFYAAGRDISSQFRDLLNMSDN